MVDLIKRSQQRNVHLIGISGRARIALLGPRPFLPCLGCGWLGRLRRLEVNKATWHQAELVGGRHVYLAHFDCSVMVMVLLKIE